jgi:hypothetical protein
MVLLDAALHLDYDYLSVPLRPPAASAARLGLSKSWSPQGADRAALPVVRTNGFDYGKAVGSMAVCQNGAERFQLVGSGSNPAAPTNLRRSSAS